MQAVRLGGTTPQKIGVGEQQLCDGVKSAIEGHLGISFNEWTCLEALSQVVSGTCWYLKVQTEATVGTGTVWIKIFDQPWTNTRKVVGVLYNSKRSAEPLGFFDSNCEVDVSTAVTALPAERPAVRADKKAGIQSMKDGTAGEGFNLLDAVNAEAFESVKTGDSLVHQKETAERRLASIDEQILALQHHRAETEAKLKEVDAKLGDVQFFNIRVQQSESQMYLLEVTASSTVRELKSKLVGAISNRNSEQTGMAEGNLLSENNVDIYNEGKLIYGRSLGQLGIGPSTVLNYITRSN